MVHSPLLGTIFKIELLISTALILVLLILGVIKKDRLLSETAISRLRQNWSKFQTTFYLGILIMIFFMVLIFIELIEAESGAVTHTRFPIQTEVIKVAFISVLIVQNLVNLSIVRMLVGGEE
jgi:hypothetical protein